jgi:hypothetical protein
MSLTQDEVNLLASITNKHGLHSCHECALELQQVMRNDGIKGCVLRWEAKGGRGYVVMKDKNFKLPFATNANEAISRSGQHFGVRVGDFVFDNIHRTGIAFADWEDTFVCDSGSFEVITVESF